MSVIANRYIQALSELQNDEQKKSILESGLNGIANVFNSNEEFKKVMLDPRIVTDVKMEIIKEIFPEYAEETLLMKFVDLLLKENRMAYIPEIASLYENINNEELNIKIIVASEIDDNQAQAIINKYKTMYGAKNAKYTVEIDKSILGGIKVVVGNKIYDGSVETQLKQMI